jgi:hypothetical protein
MSVRPSAWNDPAPSGRIFMKFCLKIFRKSIERIQVSLELTRITGTLHEDLRTFTAVSRLIVRMRNVLNKGCRENQKTHFVQ